MIPRWKKTEITQGEKMSYKTSQSQTAEQRRILRTSIPAQSATRIATPATPPSIKSRPALDPKALHQKIVSEYQAKHGSPPDMEHVMKTVWKELGMTTMPARQK
jgi:hypothetical protein